MANFLLSGRVISAKYLSSSHHSGFGNYSIQQLKKKPFMPKTTSILPETSKQNKATISFNFFF